MQILKVASITWRKGQVIVIIIGKNDVKSNSQEQEVKLNMRLEQYS